MVALLFHSEQGFVAELKEKDKHKNNTIEEKLEMIKRVSRAAENFCEIALVECNQNRAFAVQFILSVQFEEFEIAFET